MGRAHEVRAKAMAATAAKKSKLYSIYAKEIIKAAKSNPDPATNDVLRRVDIFLSTEFEGGGRHTIRVQMISDEEK